ncbi:MAG: ABC transporter permease, partial [Dehalococcoidales bacterium]|nr:ABC transporter permease [Dehalococcoidales bacterium]
MKRIFFIALKEVLSFLRDKGDLSFSLVLPIAIFALIYGAFGGNLQFNGTAFIVNKDPGGRYSELLLERLRENPGLSIMQITEDSAERKLARSDIQMVVEIPEGFSENLAEGKPTSLIFKQRGNGGTDGQIVAGLVRAAAESISSELQAIEQVAGSVANAGIPRQQIAITVQNFLKKEKDNPVLTLSETLTGDRPEPVNQFLPGIITMFVLFSINLTAQALVEERRKGTLERLLTTRLNVSELFLGKFLAYALRGFIQTLILLALAYAVFRIFTPLSFLEALLVALIFSAAASSLGIIIGSLARSENQATWIAVFFTMLMVMISGTFVPVSEGSLLGTLSKFSLN